MTTHAAPLRNADPFSTFGIGRETETATPVLTQKLGTDLTDHRGLIELPAFAVLFDDIGGIPFHRLNMDSSSMQARLTMSMVERPRLHDMVRATGEVQMHNDTYGTTSVAITGGDGDTLCFGVARGVRVGRPTTGESGQWQADPPAPNTLPAVPALDPALSGADVIAKLIDGSLPVGPLAGILGGTVTRSNDDGSIEAEFTGEPWMANLMGTMHGGVIATMLGQACSFGAQRNVRAGGGYQLIDFTCEFHRSPIVDGRTVRVEVTPVKLGRRLSLFDARMYDGDQLLGRATADARFDV
ncbi:PaaI family thioesterase [Gordonia neofelifaecis]|uniref:Thioesterase superfamily protein n=1 Tax=Gordonia neofelifaecis NRRL B-59395 TaxID=644548 RepID=F1YM40_9ACTN|nr:PaaI family thioesterase [Gordonia neofelifaecis]EGD54291.1 thioesterase superfamily protein [Gordonia neofelifaecis NRRL B-59395]